MSPSGEKEKMAAQKVRKKAMEYCSKCGSVMISRMIALKNGNDKPKLTRIKQCVVCRSWRTI